MSTVTELLNLNPVNKIIDKAIDTIASFFPNPEKRAEAEAALKQATLAGAFREQELLFELAKAQIRVNEVEASSTNWWIAGWRPYVGWISGTALGLAYMPKALALTVFWCYQAYMTIAHPDIKIPALPQFPELGVTDLIGLLGSLLGFGILRTTEKVKDVEGKR